MALHTMRCPFISCLDLSWMYTWYISLYVLQPHPDCVHNPGVAARHIKWYTMMCVSAKKVSQREVPKRCQDRSHDKKHAPFILLHLISVEQSVFQTHKCELEISYKYIYIYILRSYTLIPSKARWYNILAGLCCEHARSPHLYIFFIISCHLNPTIGSCQVWSFSADASATRCAMDGSNQNNENHYIQTKNIQHTKF